MAGYRGRPPCTCHQLCEIARDDPGQVTNDDAVWSCASPVGRFHQLIGGWPKAGEDHRLMAQPPGTANDGEQGGLAYRRYDQIRTSIDVHRFGVYIIEQRWCIHVAFRRFLTINPVRRAGSD